MPAELRGTPEKVVFIISPAGRCGTNLLGNALSAIGCGELTSLEEDYLLHHSDLLREYADRLAESWGTWTSEHDIQPRRDAVLESLGSGLLSHLAENPIGGRWTILKTPSAAHLENFPLLFGGAKLILLVRDGRDVVESSVTAWPERSHEAWREAWVGGADLVLDFMERERADKGRSWLLVRYEDLVGALVDTVKRILGCLDVEVPSVDLSKLDDLAVYGSSYLPHRKPGQFQWEIAPRPEGFNPVGRWRNWSKQRQCEFLARAGVQLKAFGYEAEGQ